MSDDLWARATFTGTTRAQADAIAKLSAEQRLQLLQELLDIAEASGALQQMRQDKQRAIDALWSSAS